jgi:hypothetical protein
LRVFKVIILVDGAPFVAGRLGALAGVLGHALVSLLEVLLFGFSRWFMVHGVKVLLCAEAVG